MNNAPITLILIASLGLIAVISLGVFFAVRPRTKVTTSFFKITDGKWSELPKSAAQQDLSTRASTTNEPWWAKIKISTATINPMTTKTQKDGSNWYTPPPKTTTTLAPPSVVTRKRPVVQYYPTAVRRTSTKATPTSSERKTTETVSTFKLATVNRSSLIFVTKGVPVLHRIELPIHSNGFGRNGDIIQVSTNINRQKSLSEAEIEGIENSPPPETETPAESTFSVDSLGNGNSGIKWVSEMKLTDQGRLVGLAFRNKHLFAASIRNGNITVMSTPNLKVVDQIPCPDCHAYDVAVFSNGEIIVAQGKRRKLTKISRTKRIVRELDLTYATKGLAVSPWNSSRRFIYVLARTHDRIYKYDANLNPTGTIQIPNEAKDDCNFLAVGTNDRLYISCENEVFVIGTGGNLIRIIRPRTGSYSVGIAVDQEENILVVRRGKSQIDVFDQNGKYVRTIGEDKDTLWSDLVIGAGHIYVIDYMGISVKAIKYP